MIGTSPLARSQFYRNFSTLLASGMPVVASLRTLSQGAPPKMVAINELLAKRIAAGSTLAKAAAELPPLDRALIRLGETNGNLPDTLKFLANYYESRHQIEKSFRYSMMQPGFLFVVSVFLQKIPQLFNNQITVVQYLSGVAINFAVVGVFLFGIFAIFRRTETSPELARKVWGITNTIPWLGSAIRNFGLERFFLSLDMCFRAGSDLDVALDVASDVVTDQDLKRAVRFVRARQGKIGFASALEQSGAFRRAHLAEIRIGETTGELERAFNRIAQELRDENQNTLRAVQDWLPKIIYVIAAFYVASGIIGSLRESMSATVKTLDSIEN